MRAMSLELTHFSSGDSVAVDAAIALSNGLRSVSLSVIGTRRGRNSPRSDDLYAGASPDGDGVGAER